MRIGNRTGIRFKHLFDPVCELDKHDRCCRHRDGKQQPFEKEQRCQVEMHWSRKHCSVNTQCARCHIANHRSHQRRNECSIHHAAQSDELHPEYRTCDWRAKDRTNAARDTCCKNLLPNLRRQFQTMGQAIGKTGAHLHGDAFPSRAPAEQMSEHAAYEHHGSHACGNFRTFVVDGVDDEIVAGFNGSAESLIDPANQKTRDGKSIDNEFVTVSKGRRPFQHIQEKSRCSAAEHSDNGTNSNPLGESF
jgi:hypothetical protein